MKRTLLNGLYMMAIAVAGSILSVPAFAGDYGNWTGNWTTNGYCYSVPEPNALILLAAGLGAYFLMSRILRKSTSSR